MSVENLHMATDLREDIFEARNDLEKIDAIIGLVEQNKSSRALDHVLGSRDVQRKLRRAAEDLEYFWSLVEAASRD